MNTPHDLDSRDGRVADLERRLQEAEETIEAIRAGRVDALFIDGPHGQGVYTLASADRLYRQMIEEMGEGAVTLAADHTIYYCNRRFAEMVARPQETIVGTRLESVLAPGPVVDVEGLLRGTSSPREITLQGAHGEAVPVKISARRLTVEEGEVYCLVATDLGLERDRDRLRDAHRRKDEFLATLAHELRNPLAPIATAAAILRSVAVPAGPQPVRTAVEVIDRQVAHMVHLIDDLLDVARISRGAIALRRSPLDLAEAVAAGLEPARHLIAAAEHRLDLDLSDAALPIDADRIRLAQVVENLVANAAKYTPPGGSIVVHTGRDGDEAVLRVSDTGIGLSKEELSQVFEVFWQADTRYDRKSSGLGLGLALVQRLVDMHGGRVHASSDGRDRGATFEVRLPLTTAAPAVPAEPEAPPMAGGASIVVVDDNEDACRLLAMLLKNEGHRVAVAHDGTSALELAGRERPDVVVLDIGLPDLDGLEVGRRIRAARGGAVLLVALSGYGREEDRQRSAAAGFDHHFVKPVQIELFRQALRSRPT